MLTPSDQRKQVNQSARRIINRCLRIVTKETDYLGPLNL